MSYIKKSFIIPIVLFVILFTLTSKVLAASVDISSPLSVNVGDTFLLNITANADGEAINSLDLELNYDASLLNFAGYKTDGSVINLWVDTPHEQNGKIYMSGIIPGGVSGLYDANKKELGAIPLTQLLFTATNEGTANFSFSKSDLLKNDGKGTELVHTSGTGKVLIKNTDTVVDKNNIQDLNDQTAPKSFTIQFVESSLFSRTPSMLVFKAEDTDSGIKEYKIKDGISDWLDAKNPQPIDKNIFSRKITIRAYDFLGNFQEASIRIPGIISLNFVLILIGLFLSGIFVYKLLKYRI